MEELKMIIELVSKMEGDAKQLVIFYLCKSTFFYLLGYCLGAYAVYMFFKIIHKLLYSDTFIGKISNASGIMLPFNSRDEVIIIELIKKGREKTNDK